MDLSISYEITHSLLRALVLAALSVWFARFLPAARRSTWLLLIGAYLTPALFSAYGYANFTGWLAWSAAGRELGYSGLMLCRLLLPALLVISVVRPRITAEAAWLLREAQAPRWKALLLGPGGPLLLAGALVFLIAFAEFEYASFFMVHAWPVKLFDAQVGGLLLRHSLKLIVVPFAIELGVLAAALTLLRYLHQFTPAAKPAATAHPFARGLPILSLTLVTLLPALLMLQDLGAGARMLREGFLIHRELGASLFFAAGAAGVTYLACQPGSVNAAWAIPGLLGSLVLGLCLLALFQLPVLHRGYDTPLPLLIATICWLLPFAIFYRWAIRDRGHSTGAFLGSLSQAAASIRWELVSRHHLGLFVALFALAWFDLTLSTLLAPSGLTPLPVRLYNFMHYGQSARLTAMVFVTMMIPAVLLLAFPLGKMGARLCGR